jgi:CheY-like chemotaxis protein
VPQTLLLADDSATIQRVIELTFAGEDITVIAVSDGDQAIARIEQAPPDIVLADVGMPGKNGYEVAEFVKHTPALAHIPVVLLTGAFEPVDQAKANAAGCDGVLAKPFEPQIVIGRVKELLGKGSAAAAPSAASAAAAFGSPAPAAAPASEAKVEDYFDRLDAAFASFSSPAAAPASATGNALAGADTSAPAAAPIAEELDWLKPKTSAAPQEPAQDFAIAEELATQVPEPEPIVERAPEPPPIKLAVFEPEPEPAPAPAPVAVALEPEPQPRTIEPRTPEPRTPEPRVLPSIADAFSAILAAEQNALGTKPEWPAPSRQPHVAASSGPSEVVITDELVERVARRVLEQMSDRVVRDTVAQVASDVAERLVREEIERIKASIK